MDRVALGRTGLTVSVAGLGCGGNSRLGLGRGASNREAADLVRAAIDLGVSLIDTAEAYGTEEAVGLALAEGGRDDVVVSSKSRIREGDRLFDGARVIANLEASLRRLRTDRIDVFHLHAVAPAAYEHVRAHILPDLLRAKEAGKIRHLGITETAPRDPGRQMLRRAVADREWEVMMLAFHMLNQGPRADVFPGARAAGIGTLLMFVVRNIFSDAALLRDTVADLIGQGRLPAEAGADRDNPLGFLLHADGADSLTDAAYRYARHEPGADVVLFGTGSRAHLEENIRSINAPPLPPADRERLARLFGGLEGVGLDLPDRIRRRS